MEGRSLPQWSNNPSGRKKEHVFHTECFPHYFLIIEYLIFIHKIGSTFYNTRMWKFFCYELCWIKGYLTINAFVLEHIIVFGKNTFILCIFFHLWKKITSTHKILINKYIPACCNEFYGNQKVWQQTPKGWVLLFGENVTEWQAGRH